MLATQCMVQHKPALDARPLRGRARLRRHRQGPDPRHARAARRRRHDRPRRRVRRARDRGALDGGAHDRLQHDHRGRRARRHDRARRDHLRVVPRRASARARRAAPSSTRAIESWRELRTDEGAYFDTRGRRSTPPRSRPQVTWGTNPGHGAGGHRARCPRPRSSTAPPTARRPSARCTTWRSSPARRSRRSRSTACSSARAPTRASATCAPPPRSSPGARSPPSVSAMVVPGSQQVKAQAEAEGLDRVFRDAGFDWRVAGCSMCLGMNPDILAPGERCASTSNRNFEGRQGRGGRTHLVSPADGRRRRHRGALRRHQGVAMSATAPAPRWQRARARRASFLERRETRDPDARACRRTCVGALLRTRTRSRSRRFLDLGCGDGAMSELRARCVSPGAEAVLVDFSEPMLERAGARLGAATGAGRRCAATSSQPGLARGAARPAATTPSSPASPSTTCRAERKRGAVRRALRAARARRHVREHGLRRHRRGRCAGCSTRRCSPTRCAPSTSAAARAARQEVEGEPLRRPTSEDRPDTRRGAGRAGCRGRLRRARSAFQMGRGRRVRRPCRPAS